MPRAPIPVSVILAQARADWNRVTQAVVAIHAKHGVNVTPILLGILNEAVVQAQDVLAAMPVQPTARPPEGKA